MVEYPAPAISDDMLEYASLNKEIDKTVLHQIFGGGGRKVTALGKVLRISWRIIYLHSFALLIFQIHKEWCTQSVLGHNCPTYQGSSGAAVVPLAKDFPPEYAKAGLVPFTGIRTYKFFTFSLAGSPFVCTQIVEGLIMFTGTLRSLFVILHSQGNM